MKTSVLNKRTSLIQFIEEQIIGPGANGITYARYKSLDNLSEPINYSDEIINYQPLSAGYSTAILFPKKRNVEVRDEAGNIGQTNDNNGDNSEETVDERVEEFELDQQFPKQMGITCCLGQDFLDKNEDLEIEVTFRTYKPLSKLDKEAKETSNPVGVYIKERKSEFLELLEKHVDIKQYIRVLSQNNQSSLLKLELTTPDDLDNLKDLKKTLLKDKKDELIEALNDLGLEIKSSHHLSSLKNEILRILKNQIAVETDKVNVFKAYSLFEQNEWFISYINDLINVVENEMWEATSYNRVLKISGLKLAKDEIKKTIIHDRPNPYTIVLTENGHPIAGGIDNIYTREISDKEGSQKLCLNLQLSRDSRDSNNKNKEFYLKLQLLNESTSVREGTIEGGTRRIFSVANNDVNRKAFFGVGLKVKNQYLKPYNGLKVNPEETSYNEDIVSKFSYRMYKDFGIGHGCSISWNENKNEVSSTYLPIVDTPDVDAVPRDKREIYSEDNSKRNKPFILNSKAQQFKYLSTFSDSSDGEIIKQLEDFVNSYKTWIEVKKDTYKQNEQQTLISQELKKCEIDHERMSKNIVFLEDSNKMRIFRLMNSAMFMQLLHINDGGKTNVDLLVNNTGKLYYEQAEDKIFSLTEPAGWRAFQLAFILLNLDGIFQHDDDKSWDKRNNLVDLVWFPTGGGKTEAYLGLIALVILNRRLNIGEKGGGVSVIMRYTLRLLTLQQFQRASYLIMALELLRRWGDNNLGEEPITIGLWVGASSLPNRLSDLQTEVTNLLNGEPNKIPFQKCPWCSSKLKLHTNSTKNVFDKNRLSLDCTNKQCSFYSVRIRPNCGLPLNLCDESIYRHPPSLLFGTVDKFAQLAHKVGSASDTYGDSRRLFGRGVWENGKPKDGYSPPDLIIQDELHLLLGPLGSAVGLFESAIDQLCTQPDGTLPKIITSTATTRNTNLQIAGLFNREVEIFPKTGIECDDTFFSFYKRHYSEGNSECFEAKRRYMGILPTGRSHVWMQMRLAAIMLTHRAIFEATQTDSDANPITGEGYSESLIEAMDNYHSIISYFNSTREVGKTQSQIQTYIKKEMLKIFDRAMRPSKMMHLIYAHNDIEEGELTGRLSGEEVASQLNAVSQKWKPQKRFIPQNSKNILPPEFIAATNMISVGLDVGRFNQLLMNSMPRNTAEYIQASSRVARSKEGLVITIHHPFKARDVSHYESFVEFHEKMYSYVEPISITPFTKKAIDKYLTLYIGTMVRHLCDDKFAFISGAGELKDADKKRIKESTMNYFIKRKAKWEKTDNIDIINLLKDENLNYISDYIDIALNQWSNKVGLENGTLRYKKHGETPYLYNEEGDLADSSDTSHWNISGSLRVIEPNAVIKIK